MTPIVSAPRWPGREMLSMGGAGLPVAALTPSPVGFDSRAVHPSQRRSEPCNEGFYITRRRETRGGGRRFLPDLPVPFVRRSGALAPETVPAVRRMASRAGRNPRRGGSSSRGGPMTPGRVPLDFASLAAPVARALLGEPNPRMSTARELRYGRKGSLAVRLDSGQWFDHESGAGGGVLDLVARVRGGDRAAAARWLGKEGFTDPIRRPERRGERCPGMTAGAGEGRTTAHGRPWQASRRDSARRLWESTRPIAGTVAAAYLAVRGVGHVTGTRSLRFHPAAWHPTAPGRFAVLVAGVQDAGGRFVGIQRTYLDGPRKADLDPVRASLGSLAGGAVRLVELAGDALLLGEGIESTAAAVRVLDWPGGAWATLGTSGLRSVVLPESVRRVVIAADRDVEGAGQKAAAQLTERLRAEGRRVRIFVPETIGHDFCDELNGGS